MGKLKDGLPSQGAYSSLALRRRKKITTPKTTTRAAQIRRIIEVSITVLLSVYLSAVYIFSIIVNKSRTSRVITGPMVTTNSEGSTQKKIGKTSFTASLAACSSAR